MPILYDKPLVPLLQILMLFFKMVEITLKSLLLSGQSEEYIVNVFNFCTTKISKTQVFRAFEYCPVQRLDTE